MQSKFGISLSCINREKTAMNAEQSNLTEAVNDSESNNNYSMDNPIGQRVQNGATARGQHAENVSETYSAKHMRDEKMKNFNIDFKTKMRWK